MSRSLLVLCLLAASALTLPGRAPAAPPADGETATVRLVWFGGTGGASGQVGRNRAHLALFDRVGDALTAIEPRFEGPRVFVWRERTVFDPVDGVGVDGFRRWLAAGPHRRTVIGLLPAVDSPFEVLVELPEAPDAARGPAAARPGAPAVGPGDDPTAPSTTPILDLFVGPRAILPGLSRTTLRHVRYTAADGTALDLLEPLDAEPAEALPADPTVWEVRWAFQARVVPAHGRPHTLLNIGRPLHDGARRLALIEALRSDDPQRTLVLAAGEDIETFSFTAAGVPDKQRPNTWESFRRMGLTALAPGGAESAFGLDRLQRDAQQHEVPVLAANVDSAPFAGWRLVPTGPVQVLVVGLVNPDMRPADRRRGFGERVFGDASAAVARAVDESTERLGRRPDLVVVLGRLDPLARARLLRDSGHIDLLLADFGDHGIHREAMTAALATPEQQAARARERHPLPVVPAGSTRLGLAEVQLVSDGHRWHVAAVESQAVPVTGDRPADPALAQAVQAVRQAVYAPAQVQLLPDLGPAIGADPALFARFLAGTRVLARGGRAVPPRVTAELWRTAVANAVADRLDAEVVLLPPIPFPWALDGPISTLDAVANLNVPDRLRVRKLTAAELRLLVAAQPAFGRLSTAGITSTPDGVMVRGRLLDDREVYRVAFADGLVAEPGFAPVLGHPASERFERADDGWAPLDADADADEGQPLPVRDLAVEALGEQARAGGAASIAAWMHPTGADKRARWALDLQQLSFEGSVYNTAGAGEGDDYAEVRETRVRTTSHRLIAARGDAYFNREGIDTDWVNRLHLEFAKGYYDEAEDQETADDLRLSTELQVPPWTLPAVRGVPFVNLAFATELTPTEGNPRKRQVEGTLGLVWKGGVVTQARGAALVVHDFSTDIPDPQLGALAAVGLRVELPSSVWSTDGELRYFIPGIGVDDPSELGMVAKVRTALDVPLVARLALGLYIDLYAYRGQVPATHDPGASVISGLALKYDHRLKLAGAWW